MSGAVLTGQVHASISRKADCYGGRRIHLRIDGLPGWLLSLISEAGPFNREAATYNLDESGPYSVLLGSTLVVTITEPSYPQPPCGACGSTTEPRGEYHVPGRLACHDGEACIERQRSRSGEKP